MELLKFDQCSLHYGEQVLLNQVDLSIKKGQKLCLVGRNGTGKSTLLKLMLGVVKPDSGAIWHQDGLKIAYLEQDVPVADDVSVYDVVASAFSETGQYLSEYFHLSQTATDPKALERLAHLQQKIEAADGWLLQQAVESVLSKFSLNPDVTMGSLSGGWRRRVLLAKALVIEPELLLLDEPTNHLDIDSIQWLEQQLGNFKGALIIVSHDRQLLQNLADGIIELDRGSLWLYHIRYLDFIEQREKRLEEEARHNALFDKRLAEEERWIRQGIKARRTRNEGRVRQLKKLREERQQRQGPQGTSQFSIDHGETSGKLVFDVDQLGFRWSDSQPWILKDFSMRILRGDRIGIIGKNGTGKSTLVKLFLEELSPTTGSCHQGTRLSVAYFDQQRNQLDLTKNAIDNIAGGREYITINNKDLHIISYLKDFMFTGERARTPVGTLSGGERNRILLAKLFSQPSNLLVLDEPTNDLDVETLELLEERLIDYSGTVLLVSHDRLFLDNVITQLIVFEEAEDGDLQNHVRTYVGGYSYWQQQFSQKAKLHALEKANKNSAKATSPAAKKLSYKLQRELDDLPQKIADQEQKLSDLNSRVSAGDFYQSDQDSINQTLSQLQQEQQALDDLYARWEELESL